MKRFLKHILIAFFLLVILPVTILAGVLFFRPLLVINPKNLAWVLHRTHALESWSWKEAKFQHERKKWLYRNFSGEFRDFCFHFKSDALGVETCLQKISWNFDLDFTEGFLAKSLKPIIIRSPSTDVRYSDTSAPPDNDHSPPDLYRYWRLLWARFIPDMDFAFEKITLHLKEKPLSFNVKLLKTPGKLEASTLNFLLTAGPEFLRIEAPKKYPFPKDLGTKRPVYLKDFVLKLWVKKSGIPIDLSGNIETVEVAAKSFIHLPLKGDFSSLAFRKDLLFRTTGELKLPGLKQSLRDYAPEPFHALPAPLNVMDGEIIFKFWSEDRNKQSVFVNGALGINLEGEGQIIDMSLKGTVPLMLTDFIRGVTTISVDFKKLAIKLPRLSKKATIPQFKPDSRFKNKAQELAKKKKPPLKVHLTAVEPDGIHIKNQLLDQDLRLRFDLNILDSLIKEGFLQILPLKTTVFKRPVMIQDMMITFLAPRSPVVKGSILFPLREYKITMKIEGPVARPRYAFSSVPPLSQNDILAVLFFGRPMSELSTNDQSAARTTNQILAQGALSLSVLYLFSCSPVEYVGFDPESKTANAQFGLGDKSSLRVGAGREGVNSTSIRRSLGKGWYIDTSVQNTSTGVETDKTQDYGVLLERIIAY